MLLEKDEISTSARYRELDNGPSQLNESLQHQGFAVAQGGGHGIDGGITSPITATALMCSMALGVGVFMMPTVFNSVGMVTGCILLVFFGFWSFIVQWFLVEVADAHKCEEWAELVSIVGPLGRFLCDFGIIVSSTIANAAHTKLIAGMLFDMLDSFITSDYGQYTFTSVQMMVVYIFLIGFAMPYCFQDDLSSLKHVGKFVAGIVITMSFAASLDSVVRIGRFGRPSEEHRTPSFISDFKAIATAAPTICFAYTAMYNLMDVYKALKQGNRERAPASMRTTLIYCSVTITILYTVVTVSCLAAFGTAAGSAEVGGQNGTGNVLYNFPPNDYPITILCVLLIMGIVLDYPIINYPLVGTMLKWGEVAKWRYARHCLSLMMACIIVVINITVPNLPDVFGLCGSLGISVFCYILPGAIIFRAAGLETRPFKTPIIARIVGIGAVIIGFTMLTVSTYFIIQNIHNG